MITLPKPKFSETNVPIGKSNDDYKEVIINKQTHVLNDAIDRVSFRDTHVRMSFHVFLKYIFSLFIHPQLIQLVF